MKLGIFVGSFNPVHEGHIKVANYLIENKYVDKVFLLATPNYWNKQDLIDLKHRVAMLRYYETNNLIVDDIHNKDPYTYQVLRNLKKDYPNDELYLIMGADNIINLDKWKNIEEILTYKIIVVNRNNIDINKYLERFPKDQFIIIPSFPNIEISSTEIRKGNYKYLKKEVKEYINNHKLYR
jgi:nicotinate-nucleotide adenylyltransferase